MTKRQTLSNLYDNKIINNIKIQNNMKKFMIPILMLCLGYAGMMKAY